MEEGKREVVSSSTMAILPLQYGSRLYTKLKEIDGDFTVPLKPFTVVKYSCRYYASSYAGRKEGTKALIGVTHKAPIVLDPYQGIYLFPTASPVREDCVWVSLGMVDDYQEAEYGKTEVLFINGEALVLPVSLHTFRQQMYRTLKLRDKMEQRLAREQGFPRFFPLHDPFTALERANIYRIYHRDSSRSSKNRLNK